MILKTHAYARAGLIGNPSDGYHGKTISLIIRNFRAEVTLFESPSIVIEPDAQDLSRFPCLDDLVHDVQLHGYYGGMRLMKAAIKVFSEYCRKQGLEMESRNFTIHYTSNIPRLVGMAGSSALVTAAFRALMAFYKVEIPNPILANLVLSAEFDELGITAGLQDRVIQAYQGMVYMDFDEAHMKKTGTGIYQPLDPASLPPLYLAYDPARAEVSGKSHGKMRALFEEGNRDIAQTMQEIAGLAEQAKALLLQDRGADLGPLLNRNFDLRAKIFPISEENFNMVEAARKTGATAKFAGSGGTVIGTYDGEAMFKALDQSLGAMGCIVFKPVIS